MCTLHSNNSHVRNAAILKGLACSDRSGIEWVSFCRCSELRSCDGMSRLMQAFSAAKIWCSAIEKTKIFQKDLLRFYCTGCSWTSYKIVPLANLNKYLHNDTKETEVYINISVHNGSEKF